MQRHITYIYIVYIQMCLKIVETLKWPIKWHCSWENEQRSHIGVPIGNHQPVITGAWPVGSAGISWLDRHIPVFCGRNASITVYIYICTYIYICYIIMCMQTYAVYHVYSLGNAWLIHMQQLWKRVPNDVIIARQKFFLQGGAGLYPHSIVRCTYHIP